MDVIFRYLPQPVGLGSAEPQEICLNAQAGICVEEKLTARSIPADFKTVLGKTFPSLQRFKWGGW